MFIGNLIPIFYTPIMLELLGQSEYGLYKLSSSVTSYLSLISMGIGSSMVRYFIKAKSEKGVEGEQEILGLFIRIFKAISIIVLIIGIVLSLNIEILYGKSIDNSDVNKMKILIFLMTINMVLNLASSPYFSIVNSNEKFLFLQSINIITTVFGPILNLIVLYCGCSSIGLAISTIIITLVTRIMFYIYTRKNLKIKAQYVHIPSKLIKEILLFSFWSFIATVAGQLYNSTDVLLIGTIPRLATTGVAIYSIGATFNNIVGSVTTGISSVLTPQANKLIFNGASSKEITFSAIKVGRLQAYISSLIISGFAIFGDNFIYFYVGNGYEDAYWVSILMMIPMSIPLMQTYCLSILIAENKHQFRSIMYLFIAALNVIGTYFLLEPYGIIGAAAMTGIATFIGNGIIMNIYYSKKTLIDVKLFWKKMLPILIPPIFFTIIGLLLKRFFNLNLLFNFIFAIILYTLIFVVFNWLVTMNKYEKQLIKGIIKPMTKNFSKHI